MKIINYYRKYAIGGAVMAALILGAVGLVRAEALSPPSLITSSSLSSSTPQSGVILATVEIYNAEIVSQENNKFKISFDLFNGVKIQPDIKYAVVLTEEKEQSRIKVDEKVYPEVVVLGENQTLTKEIDYEAPAYLKGDFQLWLFSKNSGGLILALNSLGEVKLNGHGRFVEINSPTCYLKVAGEAGDKKYNFQQGVDIKSDEKLVAYCEVINRYDKEITFTPDFKTYWRSTFGDLAEDNQEPQNSVSLKPGEKKELSFTLPKALEPQAYEAALTLLAGDKAVSNSVVFRYILRGPGATILNMRLDRDYYVKGETAKLSFFWLASDVFSGLRFGAGDNGALSVQINIADKNGRVCVKSANQGLNRQTAEANFDLPIIADCADPQISLSIKDAGGKILDQRTSLMESKNIPPSPPIAGLSRLKKYGPYGAGAAVLLVIIGLSAFFLKKRSAMMLLFFLFLAGGFFLGGSEAKAYTFTISNTCGTYGSVGLNRPFYDPYSPGETIIADWAVWSYGCSGNGLDFWGGTNGNTQTFYSGTNGGYTYSGTSYFTAPSIPGGAGFFAGGCIINNQHCGTLSFGYQVAEHSPTCQYAGPDGWTTTGTGGSQAIYIYRVRDASAVNLGVWSVVNGQDDLVWYSGYNIGGNTWQANINLGRHQGTGEIAVHVYMGNSSYPSVWCDTANGSRICTPNNCAANTCSSQWCNNGCNWVQGTKCCPNNCKASTCAGQWCWNGCSWESGVKNCNCALPWGGTLPNGSSVTAYAAGSVPCGSTCSSQTRTCSNGVLSGSYASPSCSVAPCSPVVDVKVNGADGSVFTNYNAPATISWSVSGPVTSCTASGGWSGAKSTSGGTWISGNITANTAFALSCTGSGGTGSDSGTAAMVPPPTNPSHACAAGGASATISWTPAPGYNTFYLRTRKPDGSVYYDDNNYVSSSYTLASITPGGSYAWWVHSKAPNGAYSNTVGETFSCNQPPSVSAMTAPNWDYAQAATSALRANLQFSLVDPDAGSFGSAYRIVIKKTDDTPVLDTGKCTGYNMPSAACKIDNTICAKNGAVGCLSSSDCVCQYPLDNALLNYSQAYKWWVQVWDNNDAASALTPYATTPDTDNDDGVIPTFTTYKHEFPRPGATYFPVSPSSGEKVKFTDASKIYLTAAPTTQVPCDAAKCSWLWIVPAGATINDAASSTPTIIFNSVGATGVILRITDNDGYYSQITIPVNVGAQLPGWIEVNP